MYNKIGVFGATGSVGREIVRALVENGFTVVPFSRQATTVSGVPTQQVGSLVGFDVIVSAVGHQGIFSQLDLIERAKQDGVKRFVPSEFGVDHRVVKADFFKPKIAIFEAVEEAQFPDGWTAINCGFLDVTIPQFIPVQLESSTIIVRGKGEKKYPFTVRNDVGRVLAHTFRHSEDYKNVWLNVTNGWFSLGEIAKIIQEKRGGNFKIVNVDIDEKTPVLQIVEVKGLDIFKTEATVASVPFNLSDIKDYMN